MMYTSLVITAIIIVIILQVIILMKVSNPPQPKSAEKPYQASSGQNGNKPEQRYPRKDFSGRDHRKDRSDRPSEPQQNQSQPVSGVEKSLRDINLRLKNAEQDQEISRKQLNGEVRNPNQQRNNNGDRDRDRGSRGERSDRGNRDRGRDRDRGRGNNRRDRDSRYPDRNRETNEALATPQIEEATPDFARPQTIDPVIQQPTSQEEGISQSNVQNDDIFGRGGKVTLKRRSLENKPRENGDQEPGQINEQTDENRPVSDPIGSSNESAPTFSEDSNPMQSSNPADENNISFGR